MRRVGQAHLAERPGQNRFDQPADEVGEMLVVEAEAVADRRAVCLHEVRRDVVPSVLVT